MEVENNIIQADEKFMFREPIVLLPIVCLSLLRGIASSIDHEQFFYHVKTGQLTNSIVYYSILDILAPLPGIIFMSFLSEIRGRKLVFILLFALSLLSGILSYASYEQPWAMMGNFIVATLTGGVLPITAVAICEYCSPKHRFAYLMGNEVAKVVGARATYIFYSAGIISKEASFWSLCEAIIALVCLGSVFWWPESPYWLARQGKYEESKASLLQLRMEGPGAHDELRAMETSRRRPTPKLFLLALFISIITITIANNEITSAISESQVSVIVGAAGCGKSTRAPLAVLRSNYGAAVIVSGPRRVAAVGLARRVASELEEQVGDTVGYQVRLDWKPPRPPAGSVLYCTSGVLLRRLQTNPGLDGCSHVFIDEAHERDVNTDITLLLLKRAVELNPDLRVIVMSATLDTEVFTSYFNSCPVIEVPGRTFPVETLYLEDIKQKYNLELSSTLENCRREDGRPQVNCQEVVEAIKAVDRSEPEGAILVFLPGWAEIKQAKLFLDQYCDESTHLVLPVHSRLSTADQARMFSRPLPGVRKIVLATNIAETSITIPDVVYVVDSGAHKENRVKEGTGTASLETVWVSGAGARQRAGRAGRVQPGHCFKLYTKEKENDFILFSTPEILRVPLEQTVLDCKAYAPYDKAEYFLSQLPEPPSSKAIQFAVNDLIDLGALSRTEHLTRLGSLLSSFTLHPRLACGLLTAAVVGNCVAAANVVTHCADNVEVFAGAADRREEIREIKRQFNATSDHAALHWIQEEYERMVAERGRVDAWCERYGLRKDRLGYVKSISNLYLEQLLKSPIVQPAPDAEELNRFSGIDELTPAVLLCGANALLAARTRLRTKGKLLPEVTLVTSKGERAHVGTDSVNHGVQRSRNALLAYFGGFHSRERRALVVHAASRVSAHAALVLCRGDVSVGEVYDDTTVLILPRHKLSIHVPTSQVDHLLRTREMLFKTLEYYIERDPSAISYEENTTVSRFKVRLIKAIGRILVEAQRNLIEGKSIQSDEEFR